MNDYAITTSVTSLLQQVTGICSSSLIQVPAMARKLSSSTGTSSLKLPEYKTALSTYVRELILENTLSDQRDSKVLNEDGLIDFAYICSKLEAEPLPGKTDVTATSYFCDSVKTMASMLHHVEDALSSKNMADLKKFSKYIDWTGKRELFEELFDQLSQNSPVLDLTVLLVGSATLERALGDVYLLHGPLPCPSMLKDLLVTTQLLDCLGPHILQVLRILIGPPISLNLRNVAWHGFPSPGEIPRRCIYFILWLVPSIGYALDVRRILSHDLSHREPVIFPDLASEDTVMTEKIQQFTAQSDSLLCQICETSRFVHWSTTKFEFWKTVSKFYHQKRYSFCAALKLYYLEQGLRRVFVTVNKCPDRAVTAESTTLYTTFDEILDDFVADQSDNKLLDVLGEPLMELLFDILVHQDGPRVRDRLSHGEADWDRFPKEITDILLLISGYLSKMFTSEEVKAKATVEDIGGIIAGYESQFHKISIIKQKLRSLFCDTCSIDSHIHLTIDLLPRESSYSFPVSEQHLKLCECFTLIVKQILQHWDISRIVPEDQILKCITEPSKKAMSTSTFLEILKPKIQTVYRSKIWKQTPGDPEACCNRESEVLVLLHHVVSECNTVVEQIVETLKLRHDQLQAKQLRSRQRDNFKKLLNCCQSYAANLSLTAVIVTWQLYHLDQLGQEGQQGQRSRIRFWKQLLKFSENLRTFTHPDKNKWSEGLDLIISQTEKMKNLENEILIFK